MFILSIPGNRTVASLWDFTVTYATLRKPEFQLV